MEKTDTIEYDVGSDQWRVNNPAQFLSFFALTKPEVPKFQTWAMLRPDLAAAWQVCRMFFGIEPIFPSPETADIDRYEDSMSIGEIAKARGCDEAEVQMEFQIIQTAWKVARKQLVMDDPSPAVDAKAQLEPLRPSYTLPANHEPELPSGPLDRTQIEVLRYRGFYMSDFKGLDEKRTEEESHREQQAFYNRVAELKRVFDEPMAKETARQALINEMLVRRIDSELLRMDVTKPKFSDLRATKKEIEETLLRQWSEIEKVCPFVKGAINKQTAVGAFSDLVRGLQELAIDGTHVLLDGIDTNYELQTLFHESEQLPMHYRFGWVVYILQARAGLFDPNWRNKIPMRILRILDAAFPAMAKIINEKCDVKLPDLVREGKEGEYADIVLSEPGEEPTMGELTGKLSMEEELAENEAMIDLDAPETPALNNAK
jgi:hypothetical protein